MDVSTNIPSKQRLKKSTMQVKKVWGVKEGKGYYFAWSVGNFNSLKKNVEYWSRSNMFNWTFKIMKKSSLYTLTISPRDYNEEIECSICYRKGVFSSSITADKVSEGLQKVNFPASVINVPENSYLQIDCAVFVFLFNKDREVPQPILQTRNLQDASTFKCIMGVVNTANKYSTDFIIYVQERILMAHKAVLASRSSYFRQFIEENCPDGRIGVITIDTTYDAMYIVLSFLYTGHMALKASTLDLLRILVLSEKFGILKLKEFIKKSLNDVIKRKITC